MYQAPNTDFALSEASDSTELRPLVWADLLARLAAMRDFRRSLTNSPAHPSGAFFGFADIRNELMDDIHQGDSEGHQTGATNQKLNEMCGNVNPKALAAGKGQASNSQAETDSVNPGDREII